MASSGSSSLMDFLELGCAVTESRKKRRRRNKHVNPSSKRNLVKPLPKCKFRQPSLIDPDAWVVLVHCKDEETLHELDEILPTLAAKAGINEAILRSHGFTRLVYVTEDEETKAKNLVTLLKAYSAVFVGRTHKPFVRERILEVHGLPDGIGYEELDEALDCQFPGKSLTFDILMSLDPRREPEREILIVTHDSHMCNQLLNNGGLKLFDDRLTFKCTERSAEAVTSTGKWKKKKTKIVPESERQCFKCLKFGHMAVSCDSPPRCKHCAGPHSHRECTRGKEETGIEVVCVNCGDHDHKAGSRSCPMRPGVEQKKATMKLRLLEGVRGLPSPPPSPENNSFHDSSGSSKVCGEGGTAGVVTPPSSLDQRASKSVSEDEAYVGGEASTEEPRDSSAMASPVANALDEESESTQESVAGGVSSTTGETKAAEITEFASEQVTEECSKTVSGSDETEESAKVESAEEAIEDRKDTNKEELKVEQNSEIASTAVKHSEDSEDDGNGKNPDAEDGVLYFTGTGKDSDGDNDAPHNKTASAVASFFSDLFGAAEAPSKPLDGNFVATLRSLQESVYNDIASRHPRRGPTSPRERKPAKKRRLAGSLAAAAASANGSSDPPVLSPISTPEKVLGSPIGRRRRSAGGEAGTRASRTLAERRLRVLEQFFHVVSAILDID